MEYVKEVQTTDNGVVKVGDWMIATLIVGIPLVGLIMLFVWAFGKDVNENKKNWAKANLIWFAIMAVIMIIIFGTMMSFFTSMTVQPV